MNVLDKKGCELLIKDTIDNFNTWIYKDYISKELRNDLKKADILIIPFEGFGDKDIPMFPVKTSDIFIYLRNNLQNSYNIEICIEENEYLELALHSNTKKLGKFMVKSVILPLFLSILGAYIYNKIVTIDDRDQISVSITVVDEINGKSKTYVYEGKAKYFSDVTNEIKDMWEKE